MGIQVAIVGATPVTAALEAILRPGKGDLSLALTVDRTTADHVAQAVGPDGGAILDLPAGESREFVRALGARNVRVVDLGPDLRVPQIPCGFDESHARGKRVVALPSPAAMAAWMASAPLLEKGLMHPDRVCATAIGGGQGLSLDSFPVDLAAELGWMLEQRGAQAQRRIGVRVHCGSGMLALVHGELAKEDAGSEPVLREAISSGPAWVRVCAPGSQPDCARVEGTGDAEVSIAVDWLARWVMGSCAIDPVPFAAHAALRALRQMA